MWCKNNHAAIFFYFALFFFVVVFLNIRPRLGRNDLDKNNFEQQLKNQESFITTLKFVNGSESTLKISI